MKDIIKAAEKLAFEEIKKYGAPVSLHFEIANKKGTELAKKLSADEKNSQNRYDVDGC